MIAFSRALQAKRPEAVWSAYSFRTSVAKPRPLCDLTRGRSQPLANHSPHRFWNDLPLVTVAISFALQFRG
jgi:hypothetical protein